MHFILIAAVFPQHWHLSVVQLNLECHTDLNHASPTSSSLWLPALVFYDHGSFGVLFRRKSLSLGWSDVCSLLVWTYAFWVRILQNDVSPFSVHTLYKEYVMSVCLIIVDISPNHLVKVVPASCPCCKITLCPCLISILGEVLCNYEIPCFSSNFLFPPGFLASIY